jgi:hypothetical protein
MAKRRRDENFADWAIRGTIRGVLGILLALVAAYLVYQVTIWAFANAARQTVGH